MAKNILFALLLVLVNQAFAKSEVVILGGAIEAILTIPEQKPKGLVVIAPAKKYLMRERLFAELLTQLTEAGFVTVRFNWGTETLFNPELELTKAAEDLNEVVHYAQQRYGFTTANTVIVTKSFSTKVLGASIALAHQHVLLTPNCSVETTFSSTYAEVLRSSAQVNILISNTDPNCDVGQIYGELQVLQKRPALMTTKGDHNFVVTDAHGEAVYDYQNQVIELVTMLIETENKL